MTYEERRSVPWHDMGLPVVLGLTVTVGIAVFGRGYSLLDVAIVVAVVLAGGLAIGASPWGPLFKHVRVSDEGLDVGRWHLPADQIGRTWAFEGSEVRGHATRGRFEGMRIRRSTFAILTSSDGAVIVEVLSSDRPTAWLVGTRDPEAVVAALDAVRTQARR